MSLSSCESIIWMEEKSVDYNSPLNFESLAGLSSISWSLAYRDMWGGRPGYFIQNISQVAEVCFDSTKDNLHQFHYHRLWHFFLSHPWRNCLLRFFAHPNLGECKWSTSLPCLERSSPTSSATKLCRISNRGTFFKKRPQVGWKVSYKTQ